MFKLFVFKRLTSIFIGEQFEVNGMEYLIIDEGRCTSDEEEDSDSDNSDQAQESSDDAISGITFYLPLFITFTL